MSYIGKQPTKAPLTASDIEDGIITAAKIEDGAVVAAEIASNAVTTAKINADAVTGAKIADDAINSEHYTNGSIDTAHIAADQIVGSLIADNAINSEHYTDGSIDTAHLADGQVTTAKLASAVFTGATDIGAAIVDADLFLMDDGAGGTIRKTTAARIKTYAGGSVSNAFHAYDMSGNASGNLALSSELFDDGNNYDTGNGRYTAPSDGKYFFYSSVITAGGSGYVTFRINNNALAGGTDHAGNSANGNQTQGLMLMTQDLSQGDYVNLNTGMTVYNNYIYFGGFKLY